MSSKYNRRVLQFSRILAAFLTMVFVVQLILICPVQSYAGSESDDIVVVSMGDSYSSGEGLGDYYGWTGNFQDSVNSADFMAHRSKKAWAGQLVFDNGKTKLKKVSDDGKQGNWYFVAVSGAKIDNFYYLKDKNGKQMKYGQEKTYDRGKGNKGSFYFEPQLNVFDDIQNCGKKVDYVTLTVGGNDLDFAGLVKDTVMSSSYLHLGEFDKNISEKEKEIKKDNSKFRQKLRKLYVDIASKAPYALIIVAGYPKLFEQSGKGFSTSIHEAKRINEDISIFNNVIKTEIKNANKVIAEKGIKAVIEFASVEEEFDGYEAYSKEPSINKITMIKNEYDLDTNILNPCSKSMHPNEEGAKKYRNCVQAVINRCENHIGKNKDNSIPTNQYDEFIQDYRKMVTTGDSVDFSKKYYGSTDKYQRYASELQNSEYYYSYYDVNLDGSDDFVISEKYNGGEGGYYSDCINSCEIYTIIDGKIRNIYQGDSFFSPCYIFTNGRVCGLSAVTDSISDYHLYEYGSSWKPGEIMSLVVDTESSTWRYVYTKNGREEIMSLEEGYEASADFFEYEEVTLNYIKLFDDSKERHTKEELEGDTRLYKTDQYEYIVSSMPHGLEEATTKGSSAGEYIDREFPRIGNLQHPEYTFLYPGLLSDVGAYGIYNMKERMSSKISKISCQEGYETYSFNSDGTLSGIECYGYEDLKDGYLHNGSYYYEWDFHKNTIKETRVEFVFLGGGEEPYDKEYTYNIFTYNEFGDLLSVKGDDADADYYYEETPNGLRETGYRCKDYQGKECKGKITYSRHYKDNPKNGFVYVEGDELPRGAVRAEIAYTDGLCVQIRMFFSNGAEDAIYFDYEQIGTK
ncbi:MAG: hypothetical protein IJ619_00205 [Eubacterium sp.]|nr:hypothetical protein [Eubacterium sp.]